MFRRLFTLTLLLAGLAAARADAQAPGSPLPSVYPAVPGPVTPMPPVGDVGTLNRGRIVQDLWSKGIAVDPRTGVISAGTLIDRWPVQPRYHPPGLHVHVDPNTGTVYVGTLLDMWPLPPWSSEADLYRAEYLAEQYRSRPGPYGGTAPVGPQR